jgi:hypothetical protein
MDGCDMFFMIRPVISEPHSLPTKNLGLFMILL